MNKQNQNILIPAVMAVLLVAMTLAGFYIWKSYKEKPIDLDENTEGSAPSDEELIMLEEYDKNCPMDALLLVAETENFNVTSVKCSYNELYNDIPEGEDVTVEIYTEDFEEGKQQFHTWLAENGLAESEKLRVKYVER